MPSTICGEPPICPSGRISRNWHPKKKRTRFTILCLFLSLGIPRGRRRRRVTTSDDDGIFRFFIFRISRFPRKHHVVTPTYKIGTFFSHLSGFFFFFCLLPDRRNTHVQEDVVIYLLDRRIHLVGIGCELSVFVSARFSFVLAPHSQIRLGKNIYYVVRRNESKR